MVRTPRRITGRFPTSGTNLGMLFIPSRTPCRREGIALLGNPRAILSPMTCLSKVGVIHRTYRRRIMNGCVRGIVFSRLVRALGLPGRRLGGFTRSILRHFGGPFISRRIASVVLGSFPGCRAHSLPNLGICLRHGNRLPGNLMLKLTTVVACCGNNIHTSNTRVIPGSTPRVVGLLGRL